MKICLPYLPLLFLSRSMINLDVFTLSACITVYWLMILRQRKTQHVKTHRKRIKVGRPSLPFPVSIEYASYGSVNMNLSLIRIPQQWCPPQVKRSYSEHKRSLRLKRTKSKYERGNRWKRLFLFCLTCLSLSPCVYAIPGTGHAIVHGEGSNNTVWQLRYVDTVMDRVERTHKPRIHRQTSNVIRSCTGPGCQ